MFHALSFACPSLFQTVAGIGSWLPNVVGQKYRNMHLVSDFDWDEWAASSNMLSRFLNAEFRPSRSKWGVGTVVVLLSHVMCLIVRQSTQHVRYPMTSPQRDYHQISSGFTISFIDKTVFTWKHMFFVLPGGTMRSDIGLRLRLKAFSKGPV